MRYLKAICGLVCFLILAANIWSMSHWTEARGVYDDFCYLRQAHLFQQYGLSGLNTDVSRDDDHYLSSWVKGVTLLPEMKSGTVPCHQLMQRTGKRVIQYPPGTGFLLALFPAGYQVIPLFMLATVAIFGFGMLALASAATTSSILLTAVFADAAVYMMINPTKASYSMAPTMVALALAGFLTARLFVQTPQRHRALLTVLLGLVIGIAVNFRLPNLLLSAGYFLYFLFAFLRSRNRESFLDGVLFGIAFLVGIAPTVVANTINAGSPFATTYGADSSIAPQFSTGVLLAYVTDLQFVLLLLASAWVVLILRLYHGNGIKSLALVSAGNLLVNVAFFMGHFAVTPYYTIPVAMLSLWSLLFASLMLPVEVVDGNLVPQAGKA